MGLARRIFNNGGHERYRGFAPCKIAPLMDVEIVVLGYPNPPKLGRDRGRDVL